MGEKLSPQNLQLYRAVDEVLHYLWDPIGISGIPQARDEYHGYLPHVFGLLCDGANEQVIATYLDAVITERMGLSSNIQRELQIAKILIDWRCVVAGVSV